MPMNQMMQGPSIPARDPRMNPPVREGGRGPASEIDALFDDPNFRAIVNEEAFKAIEAGHSQGQYMHHAINNAIARFMGSDDLARGSGRISIITEPPEVRRRRGEAMRLTQRGYNAP